MKIHFRVQTDQVQIDEQRISDEMIIYEENDKSDHIQKESQEAESEGELNQNLFSLQSESIRSNANQPPTQLHSVEPILRHSE